MIPLIKSRLQRLGKAEKVILLECMVLETVIRTSVALHRKRTLEKTTLILAAPGAGNIGDQAMLDVLLQTTQGKISVIVRSPEAYRFVEQSADIAIHPWLIYGRFGRQLREGWHFGQLLAAASQLRVIGADLMDGGYSPRASAVTWSLVVAAQTAGVASVVQGFSWRANADAMSCGRARRAECRGARLVVRDEDSHARLGSVGVRGVLGSDLVFMNSYVPQKSDLGDRVEEWSKAGRRIAVLNMSGLIAKRVNQLDFYASLTAELKSMGFEVLFLPHVQHQGSDDVAAQAQLQKVLGDDCLWSQKLMLPEEEIAILRYADLVVTGRMHLAILALSSGVPCAVFSTQGKVDGLARMMGEALQVLEPLEARSSRLTGLLERVVSGDPTLRADLARGLDIARRRARENL